MIYKKKVTLLSAFVAVLALIYFLIVFFDSDRRRDPAFAWLPSSLHNMAQSIEIFGSNGLIVLNRINGFWFLHDAGINYPVRQGRVDDLMTALSRRDTYPVRALSAEARERLGFGETLQSRIRITGGQDLLLDLLIGSGDALGREVYLKAAEKNEIHSGEDRFTLFTVAAMNFWLDMRLFPQASIADVQQAEVMLPDGESYTLRRGGGGWFIPGDEALVLDGPRVDAWVRGLLEAEAENFASEEPESIEASINLRFGDGQTWAIFIGPLDERNVRQAQVSESSFTYLISEWTGGRLLRERNFFIR